MNTYVENKPKHFCYRLLSVFIAVAFLSTTVIPAQFVNAQMTTVNPVPFPAPGTMVGLSAEYFPVHLKGMTIHPSNPFEFNFFIDTGDEVLDDEQIKTESTKLIKYFLAALTIAEKDLWVNLSPYEKNRIIPEEFSRTEMGRDLLIQDYFLKQLTASLMYPEEELGAEFWQRVRAKAQERFGTTDIPMNTFNKIWIVPETAEVYQKDQSVFVVGSHLKVMLEEDFLALEKNISNDNFKNETPVMQGEEIIRGVSNEVVREILIPEIEKEVNEGKNFSNLRQIYDAVILAKWYKMNLKESLLAKFYVDQGKVQGIDNVDSAYKEEVFKKYVESFKKGAYNYIKEEYDPATQAMVPNKYFSGGEILTLKDDELTQLDSDSLTDENSRSLNPSTLDAAVLKVDVSLANAYSGPDSAVLTEIVTTVGEYLGLEESVVIESIKSQMLNSPVLHNELMNGLSEAGFGVEFKDIDKIYTALVEMVESQGDTVFQAASIRETVVTVLKAINAEITNDRVSLAVAIVNDSVANILDSTAGYNKLALAVVRADGNASFDTVLEDLVAARNFKLTSSRRELLTLDLELLDWTITQRVKDKSTGEVGGVVRSLQEVADKFFKEGDVRGYDGHGDELKYPPQFDDKLLRSIGRAYGTALLYSEPHGKSASLKPGDKFVIAGDNGPSTANFLKHIGEGLRDTGINVINLGVVVSGELKRAKLDLEAQGSSYVTRSHVEVGTNGWKADINGMSPFGEMLGMVKRQLLSGEYRQVPETERGTLDESDETRATVQTNYENFLRKRFGLLKSALDKSPMKIALNLGGGAAANYAAIAKEILGDHLVDTFRKKDDVMAEEGLADPTRSDPDGLGHPLAELGESSELDDNGNKKNKSIMEYSKDNPNTLVMSFDLDVDRVGFMWGGEMYLGDEISLPFIEHMLTIDPSKKYNKVVYVDQRWKASGKQLIEILGGTVRLHPKGSSTVKTTVEVMMAGIAKDNGYGNDVEKFVRETGFRINHAEHSLHFYATNERGESYDDAFAYAFYWLEMFAEIRQKYVDDGIEEATEWTLADYIQHLEYMKQISAATVSLKEQRTAVGDEVVGEGVDAKEIKVAMRDAVVAPLLEYFEGRAEFQYIPDYKGEYDLSAKKFTLMNNAGVFILTVRDGPFAGDFFIAKSDTSPKVTFGVNGNNAYAAEELAKMITALVSHGRDAIEEEYGIKAPGIQEKETQALRELLGTNTSDDAEKLAVDAYPTANRVFATLTDNVMKGSVEEAQKEFVDLQRYIKQLRTDRVTPNMEEMKKLFTFLKNINARDDIVARAVIWQLLTDENVTSEVVDGKLSFEGIEGVSIEDKEGLVVASEMREILEIVGQGEILADVDNNIAMREHGLQGDMQYRLFALSMGGFFTPSFVTDNVGAKGAARVDQFPGWFRSLMTVYGDASGNKYTYTVTDAETGTGEWVADPNFSEQVGAKISEGVYEKLSTRLAPMMKAWRFFQIKLAQYLSPHVSEDATFSDETSIDKIIGHLTENGGISLDELETLADNVSKRGKRTLLDLYNKIRNVVNSGEGREVTIKSFYRDIGIVPGEPVTAESEAMFYTLNRLITVFEMKRLIESSKDADQGQRKDIIKSFLTLDENGFPKKDGTLMLENRGDVQYTVRSLRTVLVRNLISDYFRENLLPEMQASDDEFSGLRTYFGGSTSINFTNTVTGKQSPVIEVLAKGTPAELTIVSGDEMWLEGEPAEHAGPDAAWERLERDRANGLVVLNSNAKSSNSDNVVDMGTHPYFDGAYGPEGNLKLFELISQKRRTAVMGVLKGTRTKENAVSAMEIALKEANLWNGKSDSAALDPVGGIALDTANMSMHVRRDGKGIVLPVDQQPLMNMRIDGLVPIIYNVTPISAGLPLFLGLTTSSEYPEPTRENDQEQLSWIEPRNRIEQYLEN